MNNLHPIIRPVSLFVAITFLTLSLYTPATQAAMVTTSEVIRTGAATAARTQLQTNLLRTEVQQALIEQGVNPQDVQARIDSLSDDEATQLASEIDVAPAGGDVLGTIVFVFLVLVITDILCLTNLFPFTVKHCR